MIGQKNLLQTIKRLLMNQSLPRFIIITGQKGSGKKTLANEIVVMQGNDKIVAEDVKMATIKNLIDASYHVLVPTTYVIPDADDMSVAAKNALLKVTEEPPNKAYWIMTVQDVESVLPTIRSRAQIFQMDNYSKAELKEYSQEDNELILSIADTPGDIDDLRQIDVAEMNNYVALVFDNIDVVSGSNALKIGSKIKLNKNDTEGYDLKLFWKAFIKLSYENGDFTSVKLTSKYMSQLTPSANKNHLFYLWVLDMRKARWGEE